MSASIDLAKLSWMDVRARLESDTRIVVPLGATEEHAHLSLLTDTLFVDRVTLDACLATNVLRAPALPFGCSAFSINFPGTISLRTDTMCRLIADVIDSLYRQGFRRMVFVTGHGGNEVVTAVLSEAALDRPRLVTYYLDAWTGMKAFVRDVERERGWPPGDHASWYEDLPFTRVGAGEPRIQAAPASPDFPIFPLNPRTAREHLGEGVVAGATVGDHALTLDGLQRCVDWLTEWLRRLPATPPPL